MALYSHIRCFLWSSQNVAASKLKFIIFYSGQAPFSHDQENQTLDQFTSKLVEKKARKWSEKPQFKKTKNLYNVEAYKSFNNEVLKTPDEINMLFKGAIEICDNLSIIKLTQYCNKHNILPSLNSLLQALSVCSQSGDRDSIIEIAQLCEKVRPEILEKNSNFQHYVAEAIWIRGNVVKSLDIFEQVYTENSFLRQRIRLMLNCLISDSIKNHSQATLVILIKFCSKLAQNHSDYYPLVCIWEASFLSEWFTDQCIAMDLIRKNHILLKAIENRIPYVVHLSLSSHRTEVVNRLIDVLLQYDRKRQATQVVFVLLDYWIKQGALKRCTEIVQWSIRNDIKLPAVYQMNFIKLVTTEKPERDRKKSIVSHPPTSYKF